MLTLGLLTNETGATMKTCEYRTVFMCLILSMTALLTAQPKPDLSGHWELDRSRSDSRMAACTMVIEHSDSQVKFTSTWRSLPKEDEAGEEHKNDVEVRTIGPAGESKVDSQGRHWSWKTSWQGEKLIEEWKLQTKDGEIHGNVIRYLADNGKTLIVDTSSSGSSIRQHMVFVKK